MTDKFSFQKFFGSFSNLINEESETIKQLTAAQKSHQQEIENSLLVLVADVVRCNRQLNGKTELFIHEFFDKQFGKKNFKQRLLTMEGHVESGTEPFTKIACKELSLLTTYDSRLSILHFLFELATCDDFANARKLRCLQRISSYLGISEKDFKQIKQTALAVNNPYYILGIEETASFEEAKAAYRKMVIKFHPDKQKMFSSEEEANAKFREIKRAFDLIKNTHSTDT